MSGAFSIAATLTVVGPAVKASAGAPDYSNHMTNEPPAALPGAGKYADELALVIERVDPTAAILIVLGGKKGEGFAVATKHPEVNHHIPQLLRRMAESLEKAFKNDNAAPNN